MFVHGSTVSVRYLANPAHPATLGPLTWEPSRRRRRRGFDLLDTLRYMLSMAAGRFVETAVSPTIKRFEFFERDDATATYLLEITDSTGRGRISG